MNFHILAQCTYLTDTVTGDFFNVGHPRKLPIACLLVHNLKCMNAGKLDLIN